MAANLDSNGVGEAQWLALHRGAFDDGFKPPGGEQRFPTRALKDSYATLNAEQKMALDPLISRWHRDHTALLASDFESQDPDERDLEWMRSYLDGSSTMLDTKRRLLDGMNALHTNLRGSAVQPRAHLMQYLESTHATKKRQWDALAAKRRMTHGRFNDLDARRKLGELSTDWFLAWDLGSGTHGEACAWLKQDHNGRIVDRIVIKNAVLEPSNVVWTKDNVPTEVATMQKLGEIPEASSCIVKLRNWAIQRNRRRSRLYLEYCPFGDLSHFVQNYYWNNKPMVPEPFAWSVFYDLVRAGILMERGSLGPAVPGWQLIVHRDLKGANVFLDHNRTKEFAEYQSAKVGDFGIAVFPDPDVETSKYAYAIANSTIAPEVNTPVLRGIPGHTRISSKTNVWGVGSTMRTLLLAGRMDALYARVLNQDGTLSDEQPAGFDQYSPRFRETYSSELLQLISLCQHAHPNRRPTFDTLLATINARTAGDLGDKAGNLRHAPRGDPKWRQHRMIYDNDTAVPGVLARNLVLKGNTRAPPPPKPRVKRPRAEGNGYIPDPADDLGGVPGRLLNDLRPVKVKEADRLAAEAAEAAREAKKAEIAEAARLAREARVAAAASGDGEAHPQQKKRKLLPKGGEAATGRQQTIVPRNDVSGTTRAGSSRSSTASVTQRIADTVLSAVPARLGGGGQRTTTANPTSVGSSSGGNAMPGSKGGTQQTVPQRRPVPAPNTGRTMPMGPRPMHQGARPTASPLSPLRRGATAARGGNVTASRAGARPGTRVDVDLTSDSEESEEE